MKLDRALPKGVDPCVSKAVIDPVEGWVVYLGEQLALGCKTENIVLTVD